MALVPDPDAGAGEWSSARARWHGFEPSRSSTAARASACRDHTRGYIHYLVREKELTGARLVTLHNLTFMALLMDGIRAAIERGEFEEYAARASARRGALRLLAPAQRLSFTVRGGAATWFPAESTAVA